MEKTLVIFYMQSLPIETFVKLILSFFERKISRYYAAICLLLHVVGF